MKGSLRALGQRFWALPLLFAIAASALGLGLTAVDDSLDTSLHLPFLFSGGPEGARALLAAIITSMISFTGLVFSITIVVLQLTSSQFSPRVLRSFLEDRFNQVALGVFVATFVYALVVLRGVRGTAQVDLLRAPGRGEHLVRAGARVGAGVPGLHPPHRPVHPRGDDHHLASATTPGS